MNKEHMQRYLQHYKNFASLYDNGETDLEKYKKEIQLAAIPVPEKSPDSPVLRQMQEYMNENYDLAFSENMPMSAKVRFAITYIRRMLSDTLLNAGIGAVTDFYTDGCRFFMSLLAGMAVRRKDWETPDDFQNRRKQIMEASGFQYTDFDEKDGLIALTDCSHNRRMLKAVLYDIFDSFSIDVQSKLLPGTGSADVIYKIKISAKSIHTERFIHENPALLTDKEKITAAMKYVDETLKNTSVAETFQSMDDKLDSIIASDYYYICKTLGCCMEFQKLYENKILCHLKKNKAAKEKIKEIGRCQNPEDILQSVHEAIQNAQSVLEKKYCLCMMNAYMNGQGLGAVLNIDDFSTFEEHPSFMKKINNSWYIPSEKAELFFHILKELGFTVCDYKVSLGEIPYIRDIQVHTTRPDLLFAQMPKS